MGEGTIVGVWVKFPWMEAEDPSLDPELGCNCSNQLIIFQKLVQLKVDVSFGCDAYPVPEVN